MPRDASTADPGRIFGNDGRAVRRRAALSRFAGQRSGWRACQIARRRGRLGFYREMQMPETCPGIASRTHASGVRLRLPGPAPVRAGLPGFRTARLSPAWWQNPGRAPSDGARRRRNRRGPPLAIGRLPLAAGTVSGDPPEPTPVTWHDYAVAAEDEHKDFWPARRQAEVSPKISRNQTLKDETRFYVGRWGKGAWPADLGPKRQKPRRWCDGASKRTVSKALSGRGDRDGRRNRCHRGSDRCPRAAGLPSARAG